ncbi:hypothetical protein HDK77DRAFT_480422 [Phyllosticta capitalensis]|uniref:Haloacid dehalogenase-like hydrolase n=1 Tax=Phyllosticta capitalensis TaxID=121624 RepID=A0ABR1YVB1_9PEZI
MADTLTFSTTAAGTPEKGHPGRFDSRPSFKRAHSKPSPIGVAARPDQLLQVPGENQVLSISPGINIMDQFTPFLISKSCHVFMLNSTLHPGAQATKAAVSAVLSAMHSSLASSTSSSLSDLEESYSACASTISANGLTWPAYQKHLFSAAMQKLGHEPTDEQLDSWFRLYKKTYYTHLLPPRGLLALFRTLMRAGVKVVVGVEPDMSRDQAAWAVEHLYLSNFVDAIAVVGSSERDAETGQTPFADTLARLGVGREEAVVFCGEEPRDCEGARREAVDAVLVDVDADDRGVRWDEEGTMWRVAGFLPVREAIRRSLPDDMQRDRSVDSARM